MAEKAIFEIVVTEKGLRVAKKGVEQLGNEVEKTSRKQKEASKAADELNYKLNQGTVGASSAARSFSKLNQSIGAGPNGLVGAYATLAANAFAVSAAFNALKNAQQAELVLKGLEVQGARTGRSLTLAAERLREIVGFGIDAQEAMQATALFTSAGFSTRELDRLGKVAQNTSLALGRSLPDSLDRLIKGTTKLEPELLDELGIMTKLTDASSLYALQNNKNADSLSAFQKRQAFLNAVLAEGELKFGGLSDQIEVNPYDKLAASFNNLTKQSLNVVNNTLGVADAVEFLSESTFALSGVLLLFASTIQKNLLGSLSDLSKKSLDSANASRAEARAIREKINARLIEARTNVSAELAAQRSLEINKKSPKAIKDIAEAIKSGSASQEQFKRALDATSRSLATHERLLNKSKAENADTSAREALIAQLKAQQAALAKLADAEREQSTRIIPLEKEAMRQRLVESAKTMQARAQDSAAMAIQAAGEKKLLVAMQGTLTATKQYAISLAFLRKEKIEAAAASGGLSVATLALNSTLNTAKTAAFFFSTAIRSIAAAFLSLISVFGTALLVIGLLKEAYDYLYKKAFPNTAKANEELSAASEETAKVLKTQNDALAEQARIMASSGPVGDKVIMVWTSQANAAIELAASLQKLVAAQKARREAEALDALESSGGAARIDRSSGAKKFGIEETSAAFSVLPDLIRDSTTGIEQFLDASNERSDLIKTVDILGKTMGRAGLVAAIKESTGSLEKFQSLSEDERMKVLAEITENNANSAVRMSGAIEQLNAALSEGSTEASKFFKSAVPQTPFDGIVSSFEKFNASLKVFKEEGKSAREVLNVITKLSPEMQNFLSPKDTALLNQIKQAETVISTLEPKVGKLSKTEVDRLNSARQIVANSKSNLTLIEESLSKAEEENRQRQATIALSKAFANFEQARLSKITEYLNSGAEGMKAQMQAQNRINELNIAGAKVQKSILDAMLAQKEASLALQRLEKEKLERKRDQLLEEKKITLELYKQARAETLAAQQSVGVLKPGGEVDNASSSILDQLESEIRSMEDGIKAGENSLRTLRLQSRAIGLDIAASQVAQFSKAEIAAKAAVAAAEQLSKKTADRLAIEKLITEEKNLDTQLGAASRGNTIQGNTVNSGSPIMRNAFDTQAEILARNFESSQKELVTGYADSIMKIGFKINEAEIMKRRVRLTEQEKKGIEETISSLKHQLEIEGQRFDLQSRILEKEYHINLLKELGISDSRAELQLRQEILATAQRELDTRQELARARFANTAERRSSVAAVVGANLPGEAAREAAFAAKQAEESASMRKAMIALEYDLLEAQRQFLEQKLRAGAAELMKQKDFAGALEAEQLANSVASNKQALANAKTNALGLVDAEVEKKQLEASKARITQYTNVLLDNFKKLGPKGEAAAAIFSGMGEISFAVVDAFKAMSDAGASTTEKIGAIAGAMSQVLGSVISIVNAISNAKLAAVDKEIKAEEKRDGKSAQSVAKLEALEKKKDSIARKQFDLNKKLMMAQAVMATAASIAMALTAGPIAGPILAGIIGAMGAAQIALIASTQYESSSSSRAAQPPSTLAIGRRSDSVDLARGPSANAGGEAGFLRGSQGVGTNASNFRTIGSAYGGELVRGYGNRGFVVGEKGPEVITPETPITVTPANESSGTAPVNATFNIQALDASGVQEILLAQKGNLIKMLRDAANASGQGFLEDVNVNIYTRPGVNKL